MSFYRTFISAVAALGLATSVFAADEAAQTSPADETVTQTTSTTTDSTTTTQTQVNVNTATAKELAKVKGLNMMKAKAIVAYRTKNGNFTSLDDLKKVKALSKIKDKQLEALQAQLTTE
jgi:competence protein ComEA